ncbi:uncharacterized protein BO80DRAFT_34319 [Aspergillus ibericus CBS 121593]|uniref:Uncharacterized protein n=1 Tax=Aspergillus ibericus CBS 121593 TaxID=1448316 RepID=A0A395H458_9EURO|nr:hypothetical protein BO80DRAFT_34319 [Aspergillus ibericus CBS 121593]RAL02420.1 hypothetical protein BO80DRAFT_34319 [Aspergillus ibericus CBS 121593]
MGQIRPPGQCRGHLTSSALMARLLNLAVSSNGRSKGPRMNCRDFCRRVLDGSPASLPMTGLRVANLSPITLTDPSPRGTFCSRHFGPNHWVRCFCWHCIRQLIDQTHPPYLMIAERIREWKPAGIIQLLPADGMPRRPRMLGPAAENFLLGLNGPCREDSLLIMTARRFAQSCHD